MQSATSEGLFQNTEPSYPASDINQESECITGSSFCYLKKVSSIFLFILLVFISANLLHADTTETDNFDSNLEGWTGSGVSRVFKDGSQRMRIEQDRTATKTYSFTAAYANADITVDFSLLLDGGWENNGGNQDYFYVVANGTTIATYSHTNGTYPKSVTTTADGSGNLQLQFRTDTSANAENAFVDNINVTAQSIAISCSTLRDSENLTAGTPSYTNSDHYNENDWNVGPNATAKNRAYKFTVDSAGTVDIDLTRIDQNQANFSVSQSGCPTTEDGLTSSQLTFANAGEFYVYIYYVSGSHNNIEHQLDVVFTPPPIATAVDDSFNTQPNTVLNGNVLTNDSGTGIKVISNTDPSSGDLNLTADGSFTYMPASGFTGTDTFTYTIEDDNSNTDSATVTVNVNLSTDYDGLHAFSLINPPNTRNIIGNFAIAGNTVMCLTDHETSYGGTCQDAGYELETSNRKISKYIDIDGDGSTWNSTSSYIELPDTYDNVEREGVLWAGLFWQGRISTDTNYVMHYGEKNGGSYNFVETGNGSGYGTLDITTTDANKINLKIDNGSYHSVQASTMYTYDSSGGTTYASFADVTSVLQTENPSIGKHVFTVANLTTNEGREPSPGVFGGWSLVVIYTETAAATPRNISIYSGFDKVSNPSSPITISGLKLPLIGEVKAQVSIFSGEGEYRYGYRTGQTDKYDWMKISDTIDSGYDFMPGATNNKNIFDSILDGILRDDVPSHSNNLQVNNDGVDVDLFDISTLVSGYRTSNPDIDTLYVQWSSNNDYITPSMMAFSAELYQPGLCYDYTFDVGGYIIPSVNNDINTSFHNQGLPLTTHVSIRSIEGDFDLKNVRFTAQTDPAYLTYLADSAAYAPNLIFDYQPVNPPQIHDISADLSSFTINIGQGAGASGGILPPNETHYLLFAHDFNTSQPEINTNMGMQVSFNVDYGSGPVEQIMVFDENSLCEGTPVYNPEWGIFNIIDGAASEIDEYALFTQVSGRNFNAKAIGYDTDFVTEKYYNTDIEVEVFNAEFFKNDTNLSCMNPDSNVSAPFFVTFNNAYQVAIPSNTYNTAKRNAGFRTWHLIDSTGALINHNSPSHNRNDETYFDNLHSTAYPSDTNCSNASHTSGPCSSAEAGCYACLRTYYGKPICSRDNFALRPETFTISASDNEQGTASAMLVGQNNITARRSMAAGYNYLFDLNATLYGTDQAVTGYVQSFGAVGASVMTIDEDNNHTASIINEFTGNSACNDFNSESFGFGFWHGKASNNTVILRNVGDYKFHVLDSRWTAVDNPGNFGQDCISGDASAPASGKVGCHVNSNYDTSHYDFSMTAKPYQFDLSGITASHGVGADTNFTNAWLYMTDVRLDIGRDINQSLHLRGNVVAEGADDNASSNFVTNCYAQDIKLILDSNATAAVYPEIPDLRYRLLDTNASGANKLADEAGILTNAGVALTEGNFTKAMSGGTTIDFNVNFNREVNNSVNPITIAFGDLNVSCNTPAACAMYANSIADYTPEGIQSVDQNLTFYYGRVHAPRYRISDSNGTVNIYYEIYCDPNTAVNPCIITNPSDHNITMPNRILSVDDIRWYRNEDHDITGIEGDIGNFLIPRGADDLDLNDRVAYDRAIFTYDESKGYPYKTTIQIPTDSWLWYNKFDATATVNFFELEFNSAGGYAGKRIGVRSSDSNASRNTNRRIEW